MDLKEMDHRADIAYVEKEIAYSDVPDAVKRNFQRHRRGWPLGDTLNDFKWSREFLPGNFTEPRDRYHWRARYKDLHFEDMTLADTHQGL